MTGRLGLHPRSARDFLDHMALPALAASLLTNEILPLCQYYAYLEVGRDAEHFPPGFIRRDSDLWQTYTTLIKNGAPMAMRKVGHRRDIYPVFRELFAKKTGAEVDA